MIIALIVFWFFLAICVYIYFGYPALLYVLSRVRPRARDHAGAFPAVSIIVAVHNEQSVIKEKIENSLALQYPTELEVIIASDGSTDRTVEIARRFPQRVRVLDLDRRGKAYALNTAAELAKGRILVFTDATVFLDPESLLHLVKPFGDPEVGGVCGNKKFRSRLGADSTEQGENLYVRYDQWQKKLESDIGSVFAADGMLYAIRKQLYVPIQDPAQADDIAISTRIVLNGHRLVYEPRAFAQEEAPAEGGQEFRRKIRVANHSIRALLNLGKALWNSGFYSIELLSHKLVRHLIPFFLIPLFIANFFLALRSDFFATLFAFQVLFYLLAFAGLLLRDTPAGRVKLLSIPYYFCLVNTAALLGVLSILRKEKLETWTPRGGI